MTRLDSKVALVTGGNSGIGLATARRFRDEGAQVAIAGRNTQTLAKAEKSIVDVVAVQADVTNLNDIDRILAPSRSSSVRMPSGRRVPRHIAASRFVIRVDGSPPDRVHGSPPEKVTMDHANW
jgi:NAD(P)-dependent dehydrogenase (short-subunit alcohol dehydrogenase family)